MVLYEPSERQDTVFSTIERVCSVFSLFGCIFIISTFALSKPFRKPITRLFFYASFGNVMNSVATLMATSYVNNPNSAACQFQGFLIQMFIPADAFWSLAMAVNVYLTFYRKYDAHDLRRMELTYLILCYGAPFVVAFTFIFVSTPSKGRMYGDASLWCWVSSPWDIWRIATFYGPVWVAIFITFFIYIRTGGQIYHRYKALKSLNSSNRLAEQRYLTDPISTTTNEIYVTSEIVASFGPAEGSNGLPAPPPDAYSVTITSEARQPRAPRCHPCLSYRPHRLQGTHYVTQWGHRRVAALDEANNAAWSYARCALLFFTALLITWIPSTVFRVYTVINKNQPISLGLEYTSAFVLPLQGFWNGFIYAFATRRACKRLFEKAKRRFPLKTPLAMSSDSRGDRVIEAGVAADGIISRSCPSPVRQPSKQRNSFMMGFVSAGRRLDLDLFNDDVNG
ncbi:family A G protein-coupled receptor-like protein [Cryphonectria parasitica EP155]|uniref:Family A G protein-coupled receptor-like protein n=1 Tax=Cryphonectria parasitica (strain ATCC 38755 / EP155) TaxID=660469 RepID=A0A9P5CSY2_CRYP1|nr:family A G protein-coupled receptor-like protein [Cryphonectria parasitica EP155]KAF3768590.1 family A G protein-coupled receptor-like protein [Cryphonectria parasitica EP155]